MTEFEERVAVVLSSLGRGEVATYGEVAAAAGHPGAARAVGRFLSVHGAGFPWWRVVGAGGRLVAADGVRQARLLRAEGVAVRGRRIAGARSR